MLRDVLSCGGKHSPAVELDDNLAGSVVIDLLELANVTCETRVSICCEKLNIVLHKGSPRMCKTFAGFYLSAT